MTFEKGHEIMCVSFRKEKLRLRSDWSSEKLNKVAGREREGGVRVLSFTALPCLWADRELGLG